MVEKDYKPLFLSEFIIHETGLLEELEVAGAVRYWNSVRHGYLIFLSDGSVQIEADNRIGRIRRVEQEILILILRV
jgi:hypothetical protein